MQRSTLIAAVVAALTVSDSLTAQRGRWRRPEEVQNRVGAFFSDAKAPAVDGDKVADLETAELVRAAAASNQPTVLYLVDGGAPKDVVDEFERALFRGDELGIKLRCFHCGRIDLQKHPALKARYGDDAPLFVVFDATGKPEKPISMVGYKANPNALDAALDKAAKGAVKPSLKAFAKDYADFVRDLERVLAKKEEVVRAEAKAGGDKAKLKKAEKERSDAEAEEQKLLDHEKKLLERAHLPERPTDAQRLGASRGRDDRGNTGSGNTGSGNTGRGNTGGG